MLIVADENIPLLDAFFAGFGEIRRYPGRAIDAASVKDADVLLVRSVTRVDRQLLDGSKVRFVGTCTIGTDHLDLDYFSNAGIHWSSAPGCNARGVVDYVLGSLLTLAELEGVDLNKRVYGVVGVGEVGAPGAGAAWPGLEGAGLRPGARGQRRGEFVSLETILAQCDVISLHTPLQRGGEHPTWHLLDRKRLASLRPGAWLINASRGPVVDNRALRELLLDREDVHAVLDVWEGEPQVDLQLADLCTLATPHIAGYSLDGKQRGTAQIYQAFCRWRGEPEQVRLADLLPAQALARIDLDANAEPAWALATLCRAVYDPRRDDADFRRCLSDDVAEQRTAFDLLRKHYPVRREIEGLAVGLRGEAPQLAQMVSALGAELVGVA